MLFRRMKQSQCLTPKPRLDLVECRFIRYSSKIRFNQFANIWQTEGLELSTPTPPRGGGWRVVFVLNGTL